MTKKFYRCIIFSLGITMLILSHTYLSATIVENPRIFDLLVAIVGGFLVRASFADM